MVDSYLFYNIIYCNFGINLQTLPDLFIQNNQIYLMKSFNELFKYIVHKYKIVMCFLYNIDTFVLGII